MSCHAAHLIGIDESTTKTGVGVRSADGEQAYAAIDVRGATAWRDQPAFDLAELPGMIADVLAILSASKPAKGSGEPVAWRFDGDAGSLSFSVRQHDMVLLGDDDQPLIPTLTWQCNAATAEVAALRAAGAENAVGRIEERFILPKLMWVLAREPSLRSKVRRVMTTGDWAAYMLTGECRLSTSDALSNGLLVQATKKLAADTIAAAGLDPAWFPEVIQSGHVVGTVRATDQLPPTWSVVGEILAGWNVVAGLGDNHATGVGCGGLVDDATIVVSAGTSGTINRRVGTKCKLRGAAACFEFYDDRLLLMMLADCAAWYERFVAGDGEGKSYAELNAAAAETDLANVRRVVHHPAAAAEQREAYPAEWSTMTLGEKVASTQLSIVAELLALAKAMLGEADGAPPVKRFVLTGGMSQSPLIQQAFTAGVGVLAPSAKVLVGAQSDELSYQTGAYGALINASLPERGGDLASVCRELCPLKPCAKDAEHHAALQSLLTSWLDAP
ncbi:MAG: FGGY family carbohydrate kinase [Pirellulales bacterium]